RLKPRGSFATSPPPKRTPASDATTRLDWPRRSPPRWPSGLRARRCRCMAATDTRWSSRRSASGATRACCRSSRAPARSSTRSSAGVSWSRIDQPGAACAMSITNDGSYFEDFTVGDTLVHQRGRTITEADNHIFTSLVMNTAELHFNQDLIDRNPGAYVGGKLLVYGGVVLAFTVGLASEDTSENAIAEVE